MFYLKDDCSKNHYSWQDWTHPHPPKSCIPNRIPISKFPNYPKPFPKSMTQKQPISSTKKFMSFCHDQPAPGRSHRLSFPSSFLPSATAVSGTATRLPRAHRGGCGAAATAARAPKKAVPEWEAALRLVEAVNQLRGSELAEMVPFFWVRNPEFDVFSVEGEMRCTFQTSFFEVS